MRVLITGAGGFLGREVVRAAVARGHDVRALIRPASALPDNSWSENERIEIVRGDLRAAGSFDDLLDDIDVVIHLAASKAGDLYEQFGGTVMATENLLAGMERQGVNNLVLSSSFSVYEYLKKRSWSVLDEDSPLAIDPLSRDEYCQTKLEQERIVREHFERVQGRCMILRPGVIFGRDNLWTARLGIKCGPKWWVRTGGIARLPLTYVENCAEAIVLAAASESPPATITLNIVDDETPTQRSYMKEIRRYEASRPRVFPVPWWLMRCAARLASVTNRVLFGGTAKVPGLFVPERLHARCKPLRYSNHRIKSALGWQPGVDWREGIRRSTCNRDEQPLRDVIPPEACRPTHAAPEVVH